MSCLHGYCCAGCQAKSRIWALVCSGDNQCVVSVADLEVQLFYCSNPPLNTNARHTHKVMHWIYLFFIFFAVAYNMTTYRDAIYTKGLNQVALSDSISQGSVQTLIWVNGRYCGDGGTHCVRPFTQHCDILLLRKLGGVIVLIHNVNIDCG